MANKSISKLCKPTKSLLKQINKNLQILLLLVVFSWWGAVFTMREVTGKDREWQQYYTQRHTICCHLGVLDVSVKWVGILHTNPTEIRRQQLGKWCSNMIDHKCFQTKRQGLKPYANLPKNNPHRVKKEWLHIFSYIKNTSRKMRKSGGYPLIT